MGERLHTQDLIDLLIKRQGLEKKEAENFIKEFFILIEEGLDKDKCVKIKGLGTFKLIDVESRESVDVNTGERIEIQRHKKISFVPDSTLKDIINKPFAHFETVVLNDNVDFSELEEDNEEEDNLTITKEAKDEVNKVQEEKVINEETIVDNKKTKEPSSNKSLIIVVFLTTLLCVILLFFTYYDDIIPPNKKKQPVTISVVSNDTIADRAKENSIDSISSKDTIENKLTQNPIKEDNPETPPAITSSQKGSGTIPFSQIPIIPDSTSYEIIGTKAQHILCEGETLIRLSYRYYGTKNLFPYIIKHNRSTIKNPNVVPLGTVINIPDLEKK